MDPSSPTTFCTIDPCSHFAHRVNRAIVLFALIVVFVQSILGAIPARAQEDPNQRVLSVQDGEFSKPLHIPTYEWIPKGRVPDVVVLAIHGLTLHGQTYQLLGKAFAADGIYTCSTDMRGFGRCYSDPDNVFSTPGDDRHKVDYEKSYAEIVKLATLIHAKYPDVAMFAMGESLGTSFCIRLASEHPELIHGLILSGPVVRVHPLMFVHPHNLAAAGWGIAFNKMKMSTSPFVKNLVSNDPNIVTELLNDPLCRKDLTIAELLKTDKFVRGTLRYARNLKTDEPVLVLQGSEDRCMVPHAVTQLFKNVESADQTLRWLHAHGHILLETRYLRPATVDSVDLWTRENKFAHLNEEKKLKETIVKLGAPESTDER